MASDLTTSGLLYEGNFDEWLPRMSAILSQQHGCAINPRNGQPLSVSGTRNRKEKADTIWGQTSPYVKVRVPEASRGQPNTLLGALREIARPFRFSDLPPEIRNRIYLFVMPSHAFTGVKLSMKPEDHARMWRMPKNKESVLCINRQLRVEALPFYHQNRAFCVWWRNDDYPLNTVQQHSISKGRVRRVKRNHGDLGLAIARSLNEWASIFKSDTLRSLRRVTLLLGPRKFVDGLRLCLRTVNGNFKIEFEIGEWLSQETMSLLREHAATVSGVANALKLEGEALMLFLTSRPEIWDRVPEIQG